MVLKCIKHMFSRIPQKWSCYNWCTNYKNSMTITINCPRLFEIFFDSGLTTYYNFKKHCSIINSFSKYRSTICCVSWRKWHCLVRGDDWVANTTTRVMQKCQKFPKLWHFEIKGKTKCEIKVDDTWKIYMVNRRDEISWRCLNRWFVFVLWLY